MLMWIESFLCQRLIRCKFHNIISSFKRLRQGLTQDEVLSCLNIMINDLKISRILFKNHLEYRVYSLPTTSLCGPLAVISWPLWNQSTRHFVPLRNRLI
ncbi:hypothetical protein CDAR_115281 [Caerostris darwini]|uniref:Maturase K n=1 Tax=Caerostris darwini TaxID=1538125 RepID=A0AAV4U9M0_9ARAC|nr:hypothetical protein CDAR_115281 [Caerostris darwini]